MARSCLKQFSVTEISVPLGFIFLQKVVQIIPQKSMPFQHHLAIIAPIDKMWPGSVSRHLQQVVQTIPKNRPKQHRLSSHQASIQVRHVERCAVSSNHHSVWTNGFKPLGNPYHGK
jgi:hypothetical protein